MDRLSYSEAVESVMRRRKCSEDEAALLVAEEYRAAVDYEELASPDHLLDSEDEAEVWLRDHGQTTGKPVQVDEDRSPAGTIFAQAERMAAKADGDYYREMSKRTSMG